MSTFSFVASATTTDSATITVPATAAIGDFAILFDVATGNGSGGIAVEVVPTGWTQWGTSQAAVSNRAVTSYKNLVSGDPGASITGMHGAGSPATHKVMFVFRPTSAITAITPSTLASEQTSGDPAAQTISASAGTAPLLVFGMAWSLGAVSFSTQSPAFDGTVTSSANLLIAGYKIYNSSPVDHTVDAADNGNRNILRSGYFQITLSDQTISPSLFGDSDSFSPAGVVPVPILLTEADSIYAPIAAAAGDPQTALPDLFADTDSEFHAPSVLANSGVSVHWGGIWTTPLAVAVKHSGSWKSPQIYAKLGITWSRIF